MGSFVNNLQISFIQPQAPDPVTNEGKADGSENGFQKLLDEKKKELAGDVQGKGSGSHTRDTSEKSEEKPESEIPNMDTLMEKPLDCLNNVMLSDNLKIMLYMNGQNILGTAAETAGVETVEPEAAMLEAVKPENGISPVIAVPANQAQIVFNSQKTGPEPEVAGLESGTAPQEAKPGATTVSNETEKPIESEKGFEPVPGRRNEIEEVKESKTTGTDTQVQMESTGDVKADLSQTNGLLNTKPATGHEQTAVVSDIVQEKISEPKEIPQKILEHLISRTATREKEFEIQLDPQNLGKISIKIAYGQDSTNVSIVCSNAKTMEILAQSAKDIGAIIEMNMGSPTTIFVDKSDENYLNQENYNQAGQEQNQQNNHSDGGSKSVNEEKEEGLNFIQQLRLGLISGMQQPNQNNY